MNVRSRGFYGEQIKRYFEQFPKNQIKIYLYEDYRSDGRSVMEDILKFLEIDSSYVPANRTWTPPSGNPRIPFVKSLTKKSNWNPLVIKALKRILPRKQIQHLLRVINLVNSAERPELDTETRLKLVDFYRDDILMLQELLDRDLSSWLEVSGCQAPNF